MAESLHERYDRDERRLLDTAGTEIPTDDLLDAVIDVASPIIAASAWESLPDDAPPRTTERYTAAGALTAMALRTARTTALTVRAGYVAEALADVRRLFEIAGHAQSVAEDASGQYAANWLGRHGRAARPRAAFGEPDSDPMWKLMSGPVARPVRRLREHVRYIRWRPPRAGRVVAAEEGLVTAIANHRPS